MTRSEMPEHHARLEDLVTEFIERKESGETLDTAEFASRHPDVEVELRDALSRVDKAFAMFPGASTDHLPQTIGSYRVCGEIGRGGMGRVLRVESDDCPGEAIALKLLSTPSWLNPRAVERLRREGHVLQRLAHRGIVRILDIGDLDGMPYLAMEHLGGGSLANCIRQAKERQREGAEVDTLADWIELPSAADDVTAREPGAKRVARLMATAAHAVAAAHAEGLLHRDIKPANIMLRENGEPVLIDFGLAGGDAGPTLTRTGDVLGTPQYMAPEQATGGRVDQAADIYSLGAVLYELLTLRPPHDGGQSASVLEAVRSRPIKPIRRLDAGLPRDLETIVLRATAYRPERRYASASAMAQDLEAFLQGIPVRANRPGIVERGADAWRFHGRSIAVAAAVLLALVAVVVLSWPRGEDLEAVRDDALDRVAMAWADRDEVALAAAVDAFANADAEPQMVACLRAFAAGEEIPTPGDDSAIAVLARGIRQYRAKERRSAAETLQRAAALSPGVALPVVMRGFAARRTDQLDVAEAELNAALRMLPRSFGVRVELAKVYRAKRRYREAAAMLRDAIAERPDDAEVWHDLARMRYNIERDKLKHQRNGTAGLEAVDQAIALAGAAVTDPMRRTRGHFLDMNKRYAEAEPIFRDLLRRDPEETRDRFSLAYCLDAAHRMNEAKIEYEKLCEQLPKSPRPRLCLAYLHAGSDLQCDKCRRFFDENKQLIQPDRAEQLSLEALRLDRGRDAGAVSTALDIAVRFDRREALGQLLGELIREATEEGDDTRIAFLSKMRLSLSK